MHARTLIASHTLLLLYACATAPPPATPLRLVEAAPDPSAAPVEEVATDVRRSFVVCRAEVITGTRIPQRTCRTRSQIEIEKAQAAETTERLSVPGPIGGAFKFEASH